MDEPVLFHLAGVRLGDGLARADPSLRPALFARFPDLTKLRYDFPLILAADGPRPLSAIVDEALGEVAPKGVVGDRIRRAVLRVERGIRALAASGHHGTLSVLWARAAGDVVAARGAGAGADLARARAAIVADGEVVDCDAGIALRVVGHTWRALRDERIAALRTRIDRASARLADLVTADLQRSEAGRRPERLRRSVGAPHRDLFDFDLMAHLLATPSGPLALPATRRRRIEDTLVALRRARAFLGELAGEDVHDAIDTALAAFRSRAHGMAELARAMAVAELEADGVYVEAAHDAQVRRPDDEWLRPEILALFPDLLVRIGTRRGAASLVRAQLLEGLTSGVPLKVLFETDDAIGVDAQLATSAMGLGDIFVVQAPSAHLHRMIAHVRAAVAYPGASLISMFTGAPERGRSPAYLVASAALTSRTFPAFAYDPSAGPDWEHRFTLDRGPQPDRAWPVYELAYAGPARRRMTAEVAVTTADLALCDPRRSPQLALATDGRWDGDLVPVAEALDEDVRRTGRTPYVHAIDGVGILRKVLVDHRLVETTRRTAQAWQRLVELDGLKHVATTPAAPPPEVTATNGHAVSPGTSRPPGAQTEARSDEVEHPGRASGSPASEIGIGDHPYIETLRCSTCNECTLLNPRMFAYNENKQAYIKDITAGTYRELVEAAESCQVAIIHPGKPRDPNEPGLDELLRRAEAFR
jgi:hypothetical protein